MAEEQVKATEQPTMEEPKEEPTAEGAKDEMAQLIAELEKIGVEKPEQIQGMFQASQQTGKAWNEVGELRKEVDRLTKALQEKPQVELDDYATGGETIDLANIVKKAVKETYVNDILKPQQEAQTRMMQERAAVESDEDYGLVRDVFEKHMSNPQVQAGLYSGQTTITNEYNKVVRTYYRTVAKRSRDILKGMTEKAPKTPHVEAGETRSIPLPPEDEEKKTRMNNISQQRQSGALDSDAALKALINEVIPEGDPILT